MARKATGTIIEHTGRDGLTYRSLRFSAHGKRRFVALGAVTQAEAGRQLRGVLADVERGVWKEPAPPAPEPEGTPTFHEFAEQWWIERERELRPRTRTDYKWRLEAHLLPFFGEYQVDRISIADVDRYKAAKLAEADELRRRIEAGEKVRHEHGQRRRPCSPATINKTLDLLSSIMEVAEERELVARNPARGRRRRVNVSKPRRSYLDTAAQIGMLLEAAGRMDAESQLHPQIEKRLVPRRATLATLVFAGLRISELLDLRWRDVDLATGRLRVQDAKTDAGQRDVRLLPALREELAELKASRGTVDPAGYVFGTARGRRQSESNVRQRILAPAADRANEQLTKDGASPLPAGITPHSLRRTFASLLYALGEDPPTVMAEMGHTDPGLALRIYAQAMRRDEAERDRLRALVDGQLAVIGIPAVQEPLAEPDRQTA
jgi:integrase